jgi:uncharacterized membrane protein YkvA (DUF1232 family)
MTAAVAYTGTIASARHYGTALLNPRKAYGAKLVLLAGFGYSLGPIDLIPNSIPVIGYADQVGFALAGIAASFLLVRRREAAVASARPAAGGLKARLRGLALNGFAWAFSPMILRLATGAWPAPMDVARFRRGFRHFTPLPPLLRGLMLVPSARPHLMRTMLANWLAADEAYQGALRQDLGTQAPTGGDCLRVWTGPKLTFMHLEKTAGMALVQTLSDHFHPLQIDTDPRRAFPAHVLSALPTSAVPHIRRSALVWGHYDIAALRRLGFGAPGHDRFTFTVLREPRARIVSLYRYWRAQAALDLGWNGMNAAVLAAQRLSLAEFLQSDDPLLLDYIDNFYVRRLTGQYSSFGADALALDPQACLAEAQRTLAQFDFIGICEDMAGTLAGLASRLDFPPPKHIHRVNASPAGAPLLAADPAVDASLARLTRLDREIYVVAVARFASGGQGLCPCTPPGAGAPGPAF